MQQYISNLATGEVYRAPYRLPRWYTILGGYEHKFNGGWHLKRAVGRNTDLRTLLSWESETVNYRFGVN